VKVKKTSVPAFRPGASFKDLVAAGKLPKKVVTRWPSCGYRRGTRALPRCGRSAARRTGVVRLRREEDHDDEEDCGLAGDQGPGQEGTRQEVRHHGAEDPAKKTASSRPPPVTPRLSDVRGEQEHGDEESAASKSTAAKKSAGQKTTSTAKKTTTRKTGPES
jgi:DNA-binding protein HU-beta